MNYGEQIPEKQTRNSSVKFSRPNQEEKIDNKKQYNTKRTYAAVLISNRPTERQNQAYAKYQQHDEILNNHNHRISNTTYSSSKNNTFVKKKNQKSTPPFN